MIRDAKGFRPKMKIGLPSLILINSTLAIRIQAIARKMTENIQQSALE